MRQRSAVLVGSLLLFPTLVWGCAAEPAAPAGAPVTVASPTAGPSTAQPSAESSSPPSPTPGRTTSTAPSPSPEPSSPKLSSPEPSRPEPSRPEASRTGASGTGAGPLPSVPTAEATLPAVDPEVPPPARFRAESIDVDLPVVPVGVADDGQMELPGTVTRVGWYSFGPRPGDAEGTTVLAAHVDTKKEGLGPFARLRDLDRGDPLVVVDAEGRSQPYVVEDVDDVEKDELALDQLFRRDGPAVLKVITCGGPYDRRTGYRDNVVVTARPR